MIIRKQTLWLAGIFDILCLVVIILAVLGYWS